MGATFEPSGLYRFNAVMRWRTQLNLTTAATRTHAHALQTQFTEGLQTRLLNVDQLMVGVASPQRGQFLTFKTETGQAVNTMLKKANIITDVRGDRLRFGFGVAQSAETVSALLERLNAL